MNYIKTAVGQKAFKERSVLFSARQRTAFIMFDGVKSVEQVMGLTPGLGLTSDDIASMVAHGFLAPAPGQRSTPPAASVAPGVTAPLPPASATARTPQERYSQAKPVATMLAASLGLRGFMLNLAVESAAGYEDLLTLLPKLQNALGAEACRELEGILKG